MSSLLSSFGSLVIIFGGSFASAFLLPDQWLVSSISGFLLVGAYLLALSIWFSRRPAPRAPAQQDTWPPSYWYGLGAILVAAGFIIFWIATESRSTGAIPARFIAQTSFLAGATVAVGLIFGFWGRRFSPR